MASSSFTDAQDYLQGLEYPASKADIIDNAQEEGADERMVSALRDQLPDGLFESPQEVKRAMGDSI